MKEPKQELENIVSGTKLFQAVIRTSGRKDTFNQTMILASNTWFFVEPESMMVIY